ncbi:NAD-dependent epimerase/dehydratase family protein [Methanococcoides sp. SA1]|nr:NAD-dependent epimerase/dehydratase family protein [Methanococcoides sp. SA1]
MNNNSIAITGSRGFIGKYLTPQLHLKDVDLLEISHSLDSIDITNWEQVKSIPKRDVLVHLAGMTNIPKSFNHPRDVYTINTFGTLNMLEWCRLNDVKKFIYASTFVYGNPQYTPVDEKHPTVPNNPYSQSKLMGEELCNAYCRDYGIDAISLRLFNVYGPHQKGDYLIPHIIRQLNSGKVSLKDPLPKRDFVYIDDVINSFKCALDSGIGGCNVFNIANGKSNSVREIADMLADTYFIETGQIPDIDYTCEKRQSEVSDTIANIDKAKNIIKWEPKTDIKTGLAQTLRTYLNECKK